MFGFGERALAVLIAGALLFAALRVHKSAGKHTKVTKPVGVALALIAGLGMLVAVAGSWMSGKGWGVVGVAGIIIAGTIAGVDVALDKKPDKPAFWAAFALPLLLVLGVAHIPDVTNQVNKGGNEVVSQINKHGK